jgi:hypothetical protein
MQTKVLRNVFSLISTFELIIFGKVQCELPDVTFILPEWVFKFWGMVCEKHEYFRTEKDKIMK